MTEDTAKLLQRVYGSKSVPPRVRKAIDIAEFAFCRLQSQIGGKDIISICLAVTDEADWDDFGKPGRKAADLDEHFGSDAGEYPDLKPLVSEQEKQEALIVTAPHLRFAGPTSTKPDVDEAFKAGLHAMKRQQEGLRREPEPPQRPKVAAKLKAKVKTKAKKRGRPKKKAAAAA